MNDLILSILRDGKDKKHFSFENILDTVKGKNQCSCIISVFIGPLCTVYNNANNTKLIYKDKHQNYARIIK